MAWSDWRDWLAESNAGVDVAQHLTQIFAQGFSLLISIFRILCERAVEDCLQTRWRRTGTRLIERHRILVQHRMTNIDTRLALKRPRARQQFVQQHAG